MIRVNPNSMQEYASQAETIFRGVAGDLDLLVAQAANVTYQGQNARTFNEDCLTLTRNFAQAITDDTIAIMNAIQTSTENISASLGEMGAITLTPPNLDEINDPGFSDEGGGVVVLETGSLTAYKGAANTQFDNIARGFSDHLDALSAADWEGAAQSSAISAVTDYTDSAQTAVNQAREQLNEYIDAQITATEAADV